MLVVLPLLVLFSAIPTVTSFDRRPSLPQRVSIRAPLSTRGRRLSSLLAISSLSQHVLKAPLSATSRKNLVTVVHLHVLLATMPPSSVTLPMRTRPAFGFHLARRRPSLAVRAPLSELLLVVDVLTSRCSRLAGHITNTRPSATSMVQL